MSEFPTTKPAGNIGWSLTGRKRLPFFSRQNGFVDLTAPLLDEWNYMADAHERNITNQEGRTYRAFDSIVDAVDALSPGDVFFYNRWGMAWDEVDTQPTDAAIPIEHIATDGRRVYITYGLALVALTAKPSVSVETEWSIDLSSYGVGAVLQIDTDGVIIALATTGTTKLLIVNAVTGAVIAEVTTPSILKVRCYSVGGVGTVYAHAGGTSIHAWTLAGGLVTLHTLETGSTVLANPIELADDRLWFIYINLGTGVSAAAHIPIGGGSETVASTFTLTVPAQDFGHLNYDGFYRQMYASIIDAIATDTRVLSRDALINTINNPGPWRVSSRWIFGPGLPYSLNSEVAYRDDFRRTSVADVFSGAALNLTGLNSIGSKYRWHVDTAFNLVCIGILCQPGLWKIREDVESGASRRLIAQPLGVNYG